MHWCKNDETIFSTGGTFLGKINECANFSLFYATQLCSNYRFNDGKQFKGIKLGIENAIQLDTNALTDTNNWKLWCASHYSIKMIPKKSHVTDCAGLFVDSKPVYNRLFPGSRDKFNL